MLYFMGGNLTDTNQIKTEERVKEKKRRNRQSANNKSGQKWSFYLAVKINSSAVQGRMLEVIQFITFTSFFPPSLSNPIALFEHQLFSFLVSSAAFDLSLIFKMKQWIQNNSKSLVWSYCFYILCLLYVSSMHRSDLVFMISNFWKYIAKRKKRLCFFLHIHNHNISTKLCHFLIFTVLLKKKRFN